MARAVSHFQFDESLLEPLLRLLRIRQIKKYIPSDSRVLDAGCGYSGYLLFGLMDLIKSGVGVDLSVAKIKNKKVSLVEADLNSTLPFDTDCFDCVISLANMEHLEKPDEALSEFHRILSPRGKLVITTPSKMAKPILEFLADKLHILSQEEIHDHKQYFTPKSLTASLIKAGFDPKNISVSTFQFGLNILAIASKS